MQRRRGLYLLLSLFCCSVLLAILIALTQPPAHAQGTTRYVAGSGNDTGLCDAPAHPCRTVQYAVDVAQNGDLIKVAAGRYAGVRYRRAPDDYPRPWPDHGFISQIVDIRKTLTIRGGYLPTFDHPPDPEANLTALDAEGQGRVLFVAGAASPTLEGLILINGNAAGMGGAPALTDLDRYDAGGGIYVLSATLTLSGSYLLDSRADRGGGACALGGTLRLAGTSVVNNSANPGEEIDNTDEGGHGGGLYLWRSHLALEDSIVQGNRAGQGAAAAPGGDGGGLYLWSSQATLDHSTAEGNSAGQGGPGYNATEGGPGGAGGGLYLASSTIILTDSIVISNKAGNGGGSQGDDWDISPQGGTGGAGGGLYLASSAITLTTSIVISNEAGNGGGCGGEGWHIIGGQGGPGGGFYSLDSVMILAQSAVSRNHAGKGGGVGSSNSHLKAGHGGHGGGLSLHGSEAQFDDTTIEDNAAGDGGKAYAPLWLNGGWAGNGGHGGGLHLQDSTVRFLHGRISRNRAGDGAPGDYDPMTTVEPDELSELDPTQPPYPPPPPHQMPIHAGDGGHGGGAIFFDSQATMVDTIISDNQAGLGPWCFGSGGAGGGLYLQESGITLSGSTIWGNSSGSGDGSDGGHGGGLLVQDSSATLINCAVISNTTGSGITGGAGGGLWVAGGTLTLRTSTVSGNRTGDGDTDLRWLDGEEFLRAGPGGSGGGLYAADSLVTVANSQVNDNRTGAGGDIDFTAWEIPNLAATPGGAGGGVYLRNCQAALTDVTIAGNITGRGGQGYADGLAGQGGDGGGLCLAGGSLEIYRAHVTGNATGDGGSVDEPQEGASPADGGHGGGIHLSSNYLSRSHATLTNVIVAGNSRGEDGILVPPGGAQDGHPATIGDGASLPGSGLHLSDSDVDLVHTTLAKNKNGSGLWVSGSARLTNTILVSHTVGLQVEVSSTARLEATLWGSGTWANGTDWNGPGVILTGTLNFWDEPGFLDPGAGDYHLGPASPALDRGVDARVLTDIDLQPRPYLAPDLGADEYWPPGVLERLYLPILMRACW